MNHSPYRRLRWLMPFAVIAFLGVFTFIVYKLWNGVLTDVIGVKAITYWQALGILVLAKILFGGFPGKGGRCGPPWREKMMSRHWASLTPDEREKFREKMRSRFGDWPHPPWCGPSEPAAEDPEKKNVG